jgi:hypothetical protein
MSEPDRHFMGRKPMVHEHCPMDLFRQAQGQSLPKGAIYLRRDVARKKPQDSHGTLRLLNLCGIDI